MDQNSWTAIIVALIGSGALSAIVGSVVSAVATKHSKQSVLEKAVSFLMLAQIRNLACQDIARQEITEEDMREFVETYKCYKDLGGNGYADALHDQVLQLKIVSEYSDNSKDNKDSKK